MNISKLLNNADDAYINYRHRCEALAKEAQKYIDWDNGVSCEHLPADGLCILATIPDDFVCIWQQGVKTAINQSITKDAVERLFVHKSQL